MIDAYARIVGGFLFSQFVLPCPPILGFTWTIIVSIKISYISLAKFSFSTKLANIFHTCTHGNLGEERR